MIRNILAVIAGNVGWTILWLSYNAVLKMAGLIPSDTTNRFETPRPLLLLLVGSVVFSVSAGFITTVVARGQGYWPAIILCGVQLAFGIFFQLQFWKLMRAARIPSKNSEVLWYGLGKGATVRATGQSRLDHMQHEHALLVIVAGRRLRFGRVAHISILGFMSGSQCAHRL